jgi:hypothetical protein
LLSWDAPGKTNVDKLFLSCGIELIDIEKEMWKHAAQVN